MKNNAKKRGRAFTIVELVIVIAVIAILAAVLIPAFSGIVDRANRSKALQQARNAWNDVAFTYPSGYDGFAYYKQDINGWYYDDADAIAKYNVDDKYTVTFDGEDFSVLDWDGTSAGGFRIAESGTGTVVTFDYAGG
ncbi:MAG: type II secretion system protein [Clostridia bacterium]|nr:type II secretion system protein [Clostridia bacterium]